MESKDTKANFLEDGMDLKDQQQEGMLPTNKQGIFIIFENKNVEMTICNISSY